MLIILATFKPDKRVQRLQFEYFFNFIWHWLVGINPQQPLVDLLPGLQIFHFASNCVRFDSGILIHENHFVFVGAINRIKQNLPLNHNLKICTVIVWQLLWSTKWQFVVSQEPLSNAQSVSLPNSVCYKPFPLACWESQTYIMVPSSIEDFSTGCIVYYFS